MQNETYTMNIETDAVKQHPFHLGTDRRVAESFVFEQLRRPEVKSVALYQGRKLVEIFDWRALEG